MEAELCAQHTSSMVWNKDGINLTSRRILEQFNLGWIVFVKTSTLLRGMETTTVHSLISCVSTD